MKWVINLVLSLGFLNLANNSQAETATVTVVANPPEAGTITGNGVITTGTRRDIPMMAHAGWYIQNVDYVGPPDTITNCEVYVFVNPSGTFMLTNCQIFINPQEQFRRDLFILRNTDPNSDVTLMTNFTASLYVNGDAFITAQFARISPIITTQPANKTILSRGNAYFEAEAIGRQPLNYQWRKNGLNIPGATAARLTLNSVTAADSDCYSVVVWNSFGSVESAPACLAVLTDGANENQPRQIVAPTLPPRPDGVDSLVVVTHGTACQVCGDIAWINEMADAIRANLASRGLLNWSVVPYQWPEAAGPLPSQALINGAALGTLQGGRWGQQNWQHVHLIGHSSGAAFVEAAARKIKKPGTTVHSTFLDPYLSPLLTGAHVYGANADWADSYTTRDLSAQWTERKLDHGYNVDVGWSDPNRTTTPAFDSEFVIANVPSCVAFSSHGWPIEFYSKSIASTLPGCASAYGFALSKEGGGWDNRANFPPGDTAPIPCQDCPPLGLRANDLPLHLNGQVNLNLAAYDTSADGATVIDFSAFDLSSTIFFPAPNGAPSPGKSAMSTNGPAWLAVAMAITNSVNFVQFDSEFTSTNGAEGLLTVYWNTNQIGMIDERVTSPGLQTNRFALPTVVTTGLYALSFRLDTFNGTASRITVTNVATGFAGVKEPITLAVVGSTNRTPTLKLTGAAGFNYLLQSSTNLVNWTPSALLLNTNGTVLFTDSSATNSSQRFYRALLP